MADKGQNREIATSKASQVSPSNTSFVLEKGIFSNIFEKDIRRVYIYKKSERLAKAIHLITPAFRNSPALRDRLDRVAVGLVDAGTLPIGVAKTELSRELLALSSVLGIAKAGGLLTEMNADIISREAHLLLQEVAMYEEPRLLMEEAPTLSELAKESLQTSRRENDFARSEIGLNSNASYKGHYDKGQKIIKDKPVKSSRKQAILDVLKSKGSLSIKDISTVIREVSEKTIQRELQHLINEGAVSKAGDRRWTVYSAV